MRRVLVIDRDGMGLEDLEGWAPDREVAVTRAETVCEAVRFLCREAVSAIVVDVALLRLSASEHAALFHHVAPGVPVLTTVGPETPPAVRTRLERQGFRVLVRPLGLDDLLGAAVGHALAGGIA